jgi:hypothetical protein
MIAQTGLAIVVYCAATKLKIAQVPLKTWSSVKNFGAERRTRHGTIYVIFARKFNLNIKEMSSGSSRNINTWY